MAPFPAVVYSSKGSLKLKTGLTLAWYIDQLTDGWYRVEVTVSDGVNGKGVSHTYKTKNECLVWVDEMIYCYNLTYPKVIP